MTKDVAFNKAEKFTVNVLVPFSEQITTQVKVPFTKVIDVEVLVKVVEQQPFTMVLRYPETVVKKLPPTTVCHEHKYKH